MNALAPLFLIGSSLYLQVTRTTIIRAWPEPRLTREACQPGHARLLVTRAYTKSAKMHVLTLLSSQLPWFPV